MNNQVNAIDTRGTWSLQNAEAFAVPTRDWGTIIEQDNKKPGRRFFLKPLECAAMVENAKLGVPPRSMFKAVGLNYPYYYSTYSTLRGEVEDIMKKLDPTDEDMDRYSEVLHKPLFILMTDLDRASGAFEISTVLRFNEMAVNNPDLKMAQMRSMFKDMFNDSQESSNTVNIQIKLGGNFADAI